MKKTLIAGLCLLSLLACKTESPELPNESPSPKATTSAEEPTDGAMSGALQADVQFDKEVYFPGDEIEVTAIAVNLTDTAWVGVIPSSVEHGSEETNDQNDISYLHLKDQARPFLVAPKEPGEYDVRLNSSDEKGEELASRSFKVEADPSPVTEAKIMWEPTDVKPGEEVLLAFEAPLDFASNAWIGIVPSKTEHGPEEVGDGANLGYRHIKGRSRGKVALKVPTAPGEYDFRFYNDDNSGKEVASVSFKVVE